MLPLQVIRELRIYNGPDRTVYLIQESSCERDTVFRGYYSKPPFFIAIVCIEVLDLFLPLVVIATLFTVLPYFLFSLDQYYSPARAGEERRIEP